MECNSTNYRFSHEVQRIPLITTPETVLPLSAYQNIQHVANT